VRFGQSSNTERSYRIPVQARRQSTPNDGSRRAPTRLKWPAREGRGAGASRYRRSWIISRSELPNGGVGVCFSGFQPRAQEIRHSPDQPLSITTGRGAKLQVGPPTPRLTRQNAFVFRPGESRLFGQCKLRAIAKGARFRRRRPRSGAAACTGAGDVQARAVPPIAMEVSRWRIRCRERLCLPLHRVVGVDRFRTPG
jgi:hypothetical protein